MVTKFIAFITVKLDQNKIKLTGSTFIKIGKNDHKKPLRRQIKFLGLPKFQPNWPNFGR